MHGLAEIGTVILMGKILNVVFAFQLFRYHLHLEKDVVICLNKPQKRFVRSEVEICPVLLKGHRPFMKIPWVTNDNCVH